MNNKSFQTKKLIKDSFMAIYETKNYFNISVKEICERANIHRTTFYLHYQNIDTMLREIEDEILKEIVEQSKHTDYIIPIRDELSEIKFAEASWHVLEYMRSQKKYLLPLMNPYGDLYFINNYKKIIFMETKRALRKTESSYGENEDYIIRYMASGIVETLYYWLKNDDLSVKELTKMMLLMNSKNPFIEK